MGMFQGLWKTRLQVAADLSASKANADARKANADASKADASKTDSIRFHPEHLLIAGNGDNMEFRLRMIKHDYSGVVDVFSYKFNEYRFVKGIAFHPTKPFMVVNIDNKKLITFNLNQTYNTFNIVNLYKLGRIWKATPNGQELDIDITQLVDRNLPLQYYNNNINEVLFHPTLNLLVYCSVFFMFIMRMNENTGKIMIIKIINYIHSIPVDILYIDGRNLPIMIIFVTLYLFIIQNLLLQ
jgi:hypothetical protein